MPAAIAAHANRVKPGAGLPRSASVRQDSDHHQSHRNNHNRTHHHNPHHNPQVAIINHSKQGDGVHNSSFKDSRTHQQGKEKESAGDKQNENSWFINEKEFGSTGSIPVIPLFTHTNHSTEFHKQNMINSSNIKSNRVNGNYVNFDPSKRNNYRGDDKQDLLSMGRIQDLKERMASDRIKMTEKALWKCLGAEFIGTAFLMFLGVGCVLKLENEAKQLSFVGIALCWSFTVATLAQALGGVSCDINPAVTLACLVAGKIPIVKAVMYILIQCLGALAGTALLKAVTPESIESGNWGATQLATGVTPIQGFAIEVISTFLLVFTVFSASDENRKDVKGSVPLAVGICVGSLVMCSGPFTGASLNPARSLGPSIIAGHFDNHWVYWLGPITGGIIAALLYQHVFRALRPEEVEAMEAEIQLKQREQEAKENGVVNGVNPPV